MILIPEQLPTPDDRPDCFEAPCRRSVRLGLRRMDFRHALATPGPGSHRAVPPCPRRGPDPVVPDWNPV